MAADGLSALDQQRAQATKRRLPPARHPKAPPAIISTTPEEGDGPAGASAVTTASSPRESLEPPQAQAVPAPVQAPLRRRSRVRATQVHLDEIAEEHLTELRKRAVVGEVDLTASAVMRLALAELVERHGYDRIVRMFAEDDVRLRRGRPRS